MFLPLKTNWSESKNTVCLHKSYWDCISSIVWSGWLYFMNSWTGRLWKIPAHKGCGIFIKPFSVPLYKMHWVISAWSTAASYLLALDLCQEVMWIAIAQTPVFWLDSKSGDKFTSQWDGFEPEGKSGQLIGNSKRWSSHTMALCQGVVSKYNALLSLAVSLIDSLSFTNWQHNKTPSPLFLVYDRAVYELTPDLWLLCLNCQWNKISLCVFGLKMRLDLGCNILCTVLHLERWG